MDTAVFCFEGNFGDAVLYPKDPEADDLLGVWSVSAKGGHDTANPTGDIRFNFLNMLVVVDIKMSSRIV